MQLFHRSHRLSASSDETNLVPAMALAVRTRLGELTDQRLSLPGYLGANAGLKVIALVAGMVAGADSIDLCRCWDYADEGCDCERKRCAGGFWDGSPCWEST